MDIRAMLAREDFYPILKHTLEHYFRTVRGCDARFEYTPFSGGERLGIYDKMSFVSRLPAPKGARTYLYHEFNIRDSLIKYYGAKLLVFLAVHGLPVGRVRDCWLTKGVLGSNEFISPQNRSIRFFDYDAMTVDCVIKQGFTSTYFDQQLQFRKDCPYDFVPPLLAYGQDWFREKILLGHTLARVTVAQDYEKGISAAIRFMGQIAKDTVRLSSAQAYLDSLCSELKAKLLRAEQEKQIRRSAFLQSFVDACRERAEGMKEIPLVTSHGDLQTGNIWLDQDGKVRIYDWETVKDRSIWYDCSTLLFSTRRAGGLEAMYASPEMHRFAPYGLFAEPTAEELEQWKAVILLEDLSFYLDDMMELPHDFGNELFNAFADRLWNMFGESINAES